LFLKIDQYMYFSKYNNRRVALVCKINQKDLIQDCVTLNVLVGFITHKKVSLDLWSLLSQLLLFQLLFEYDNKR